VAFGRQVQAPAVQVPVQQSDGALQAAPRYEQAHEPTGCSMQLTQASPMHASVSFAVEAHSKSAWHDPPSVDLLHTPPPSSQLPAPPQQSASLEHELPICPHAPPQPAAGSAPARTIRASDPRTAEIKPSAVVRRGMRCHRPAAARAERESCPHPEANTVSAATSKRRDAWTIAIDLAFARSRPVAGCAVGRCRVRRVHDATKETFSRFHGRPRRCAPRRAVPPPRALAATGSGGRSPGRRLAWW
jgi:hypothetical protein